MKNWSWGLPPGKICAHTTVFEGVSAASQNEHLRVRAVYKPHLRPTRSSPISSIGHRGGVYKAFPTTQMRFLNEPCRAGGSDYSSFVPYSITQTDGRMAWRGPSRRSGESTARGAAPMAT